jgi:hypothetical protein
MKDTHGCIMQSRHELIVSVFVKPYVRHSAHCPCSLLIERVRLVIAVLLHEAVENSTS